MRTVTNYFILNLAKYNINCYYYYYMYYYIFCHKLFHCQFGRS